MQEEFLIGLTICFVCQFIYFKTKYKFFIFSPIYVFLFFLIFSLITTCGYYFFVKNKINLYGFDESTDIELFLITLTFFLFALNIVLFNFNLYYILSNKKNKLLLKKLPFVNYKYTNIKKKYTNVKKKYKNIKKKYIYFLGAVLLLFFCFFLILVVYGKGFLYRDEYLPLFTVFQKNLRIALFLFSFVYVLLLGELFKYAKKISIFLFCIFMLCFISTGSRRLILFLILYILPIISNIRWNIRQIFFLGIYFLFSIIFSVYAMQLRKLEFHGLIPYLFFVKEFMRNFLEVFYFLFYYIFIFGFFVTAQTLKFNFIYNVVNLKTTLIELNPLPGVLVGWYKIVDNMMLNFFCPFSLYGEVFYMGWFFTTFFFSILAFLLFILEKKIRYYFYIKKQKYIAIMLFILSLLFVIFSWEYHMRSAMRYIYYAIFFSWFYKFFLK